MGRIKDWLRDTFGRKSYSVQMVVGDEGFMVAQNFVGSDLYTVYTQAIWTYVCASRISQDIANFPVVVQRREPGSTAWTVDPDHELNELIDRPYGPGLDKPRWNWQQQVSAGVLRQELGGNQFYRVVSSASKLLALGLYLGELVGNEDQFTGVPLSYTPKGGSEIIPASDIVNIMHASPDSWWSGISPTVAAEQATRVNYAADRRIRYDLETRVQPGVVFKVKALFTMSDAQREKTKTMLANTYEGATKAGKSLVVGDDTTIEGAPLHSVDDIPTHAANARDAIISSFDVSPPVVGVLRDVKYQTWEQALRAQFFLCISPRLRNIYGTINSQAVWPVYGRNVRLWYDVIQSPLGLASLRERGETASVYHGLGWPAKALNDRFALEMEPFDGWDRSNMAAVVAGHAEDVVDDDADADADDEPVMDEEGSL